MLAFASLLVAFAVVMMAANMAAATLMSRAHAAAGFLPSFTLATFFAGMLAVGQYAPTQNPEALEMKAHALQVSGMYLQAERSAIGAPGSDAYRTGAIAEDEACERAEDWFGYAQDIDLR